jgi:hypothetical protein
MDKMRYIFGLDVCDVKRTITFEVVFRQVLYLNVFFMFCLVPREAVADIASDYKAYVQDRANLDRECKHHLRGPDAKAMFNFENCKWRKDQLLMHKHDVHSVLYESGYERYKELFEAARAAAVGKIEGQRQWMETWAWSQADIEHDYESIQWSIIRRALR